MSVSLALISFELIREAAEKRESKENGKGAQRRRGLKRSLKI